MSSSHFTIISIASIIALCILVFLSIRPSSISSPLFPPSPTTPESLSSPEPSKKAVSKQESTQEGKNDDFSLLPVNNTNTKTNENKETNESTFPTTSETQTLQQAVDLISTGNYPRFDRVVTKDDDAEENNTKICRFFKYKIVNRNNINKKSATSSNSYEENLQELYFSRPLVKLLRKKRRKAKMFRYELADEETMTPRVSPADVEEDENTKEKNENENENENKSPKKSSHQKLSWTYFRKEQQSPKKKRRKFLAVLLAGEIRKMSIAGSAQKRHWVDANTILNYYNNNNNAEGSSSSSSVDVFAATWQTPLDEDVVGNGKRNNGTFYNDTFSPATYVYSTLAQVFDPATIAAVRVDSYNPRMFLHSVFGVSLMRGGNSAPMLYLYEAVARLASVQYYQKTGTTYDFYIRSRFDLNPLESLRVQFRNNHNNIAEDDDEKRGKQTSSSSSSSSSKDREWYLEIGTSKEGIQKLQQHKQFMKHNRNLLRNSNNNKHQSKSSSSFFSRHHGRFITLGGEIDLIVHHNTLCCMNDWIAVGQFSSLLKTHSVYSLANLISVEGMLKLKNIQNKNRKSNNNTKNEIEKDRDNNNVDLITAPPGQLLYNWFLNRKFYNGDLPTKELRERFLIPPNTINESHCAFLANSDDHQYRRKMFLRGNDHAQKRKNDEKDDDGEVSFIENNIVMKDCYAETCIGSHFVKSKIQWRVADLSVSLGSLVQGESQDLNQKKKTNGGGGEISSSSSYFYATQRRNVGGGGDGCPMKECRYLF